MGEVVRLHADEETELGTIATTTNPAVSVIVTSDSRVVFRRPGRDTWEPLDLEAAELLGHTALRAVELARAYRHATATGTTTEPG